MKIDVNKLLDDKIYCQKLFNGFIRKKVIRPARIDSFQKHLNKAVTNLDFANYILEEHDFSIKEKLPGKSFFDWCITIYYYSIYHSCLALMAKVGYDSKGHLATISGITLFYYHKQNVLKKEEVEFIISKISLVKEDIDNILESKSLRERACYGVDATFEKSIATKIRNQTVEFVSKIRNLLEK